MAANLVKIVECPRDAWQALPRILPAEIKAHYLQSLIGAGFRHIDAVSFVSPSAVPQMADSEQVLEMLFAVDEDDDLPLDDSFLPDLPGTDRALTAGSQPAPARIPKDLEIIGIAVNARGAERAIATGVVNTVGFPYSISPTFLERNQKQTPEESLDVLEEIYQKTYRSGLGMVVYISMAFGNPYGDAWDHTEVLEACSLVADMGVGQISLADTVGLATPGEIAKLIGEVVPAFPGVEIGIHLHSRPEHALDKVRAAYEAGCRRFDSALAGMGGCPFAQDALVGNLPTEIVLDQLREMGAELPPFASLETLIRASGGIAQKFGSLSEVVH